MAGRVLSSVASVEAQAQAQGGGVTACACCCISRGAGRHGRGRRYGPVARGVAAVLAVVACVYNSLVVHDGALAARPVVDA
eukprot:365149-Chlamydomonas_euryale.AAC.3